jgi:fructuronate reductase/mannitol 2-dehydrogenase
MTAIMDRETGPTVPLVPGIDINVYKQTLLRRFSNPAIRDTVDRVNADAPLNVLLDPIRSRIEANAPLDLLALALAAWLRRVRGEDECGRAISVRHPLAALLRARAIEGGPDPTPLLSIKQLFGNLGQEPQLVHPVQHWLSRLYTAGIEATLDEAGRRAEG